jgi:hypothetical protein
LLRDYLDRWLKEIRPSLKASTFTVYRRIVNNQIMDQFGDLPLTQINWKDVRNWLAKKDASAKTKGNILSVLHTALDDAAEDELLDANPLASRRCSGRSSAVLLITTTGRLATLMILFLQRSAGDRRHRLHASVPTPVADNDVEFSGHLHSVHSLDMLESTEDRFHRLLGAEHA